MKNFTKKDYIYLALIIITFIILVLLLTRSTYIYSSNTEEYSTQVTIAEYFRTLFYDTHDLLPDFAAELENGQNIYNFAYYGFLSPIILISYLMPYISMLNYIIISTITCCIISSILLYIFLKRKKYSSDICFLSSIIFLFSISISYQSHQNVASITHFPFLILGLIGVDKKIQTNKGYLLTISVFLMIMTNYYYSIGGIICLLIYTLYSYLQNSNKIIIKSLIKTLSSIIMPILVAIICSSILILPTIASLIKNNNILFPNTTSSNLLYNPYGISLNTIIILSIINIFKNNKDNIILGIILIIILIFNYILDNTLILISFLPLYIIITTKFLNDLFNKKVNFKIIIPCMIIISIFILFYKYELTRYFIELIVLSIIIILYYKYSSKLILILPIFLITFINCYTLNSNDYFKLKFTTTENENIINDAINSIKTIDSTFYRINNTEYSNLLINNTSKTNTLSLILNGNKYIISTNKAPLGYELVSFNEGINIYKNNNVFPLGFASSNIMSYEDFSKLNDQVKLEALLNIIVADTESNNDFISNTISTNFDYTEILDSEYTTINEDGSISLSIEEDLKISYDLPEKYQNKIIFINFKTNTFTEKSNITINNQTSTDTSAYILSSQDQTKLIFTFKKGNYTLSDFETYILDYAYIEKCSSKINKLIVDEDQTKGDYIKGEVNVIEDSYFMFTIPYDTGFTIKVDGETIQYEIVDETFIGFKITEGTHEIQLEYNSPLKKISIYISIIGFISFIAITYLESKRKI